MILLPTRPPDHDAADLIFSAHAWSRMLQRGISEEDARHIADHGASVPDTSPPGAPPRTRSTGFRNGRRITVVIAHDRGVRVIITVF